MKPFKATPELDRKINVRAERKEGTAEPSTMDFDRYKTLMARGRSWKQRDELNDALKRERDIEKFIDSDQFTEQDYIDLHSALYHSYRPYHSWRGRDIQEKLQASRHNNPETNMKALDSIHEIINGMKESGVSEFDDENDLEYVLKNEIASSENLVKNHNFTPEQLHEIISNEKYHIPHEAGSISFGDVEQKDFEFKPSEGVLDNENIDPTHLRKFLDKHPESSSSILHNKKADDNIINHILDNKSLVDEWDGRDVLQFVNGRLNRDTGKYDLPARQVRNLMNNREFFGYMDQDRYDGLLDAMDPSDRKAFIDEKLGITGGSSRHTADTDFRTDNPTEEDLGWNNWENGEKHDEDHTKHFLSNSRHLDDEQVEHIKRHGDFESKYNLYHNENIDPRHGVEMFRKWHDNEENHGYNSRELNEAYKKNKHGIITKDDFPEELLEEARDSIRDSGYAMERAEEDYTFHEWVDENWEEASDGFSLEDMDGNDNEERFYEHLRDQYDWDADNDDHDPALDAMHQAIIDAAEEKGEDSLSEEEALEAAQKRHDQGFDRYSILPSRPESLKDLGLDEHLYEGLDTDQQFIDTDDIEEHSKKHNPETIDYSDHDEYSIHDHPDYDERYGEQIKDYIRDNVNSYDLYEHNYNYESYRESDAYMEAEREAEESMLEDQIRDEGYYDYFHDGAHQDDRFVPEHLREHIDNFEEVENNRHRRRESFAENLEAQRAEAAERERAEADERQRKQDEAISSFTDQSMPNRSFNHEYGEGLHHHEMVRDYAEANGGSIDFGRLNKLHPNQKEIWKKIFDGKGKVTTDEMQQKIDAIPKTKYNVTYGKWGGSNMQNINGQDQIVVRLDHSDSSIEPFKANPELHNTFNKIAEVSQRSGHPTNSKTIAWARVDTSDPDNWFIDEVQSDFGSTARDYLKREGKEDQAEHVQTIMDHHKDWRETLVNHVMKEAKKHGATKVTTHSPESKSEHTGSGKVHTVYKDSYKKIPRKMGFKPATHDQLALSDTGRETFQLGSGDLIEDRLEAHYDGYAHYEDMHNALIGHTNHLLESGDIKEGDEKHTNLLNMQSQTKDLALKHKENFHSILNEHGTDEHKENSESNIDFMSNWQSGGLGSNDYRVGDLRKELDSKGSFPKHESDKKLGQAFDPTPKFHQGHVFELNPTFKKHYTDIVDMTKGAMKRIAPFKPEDISVEDEYDMAAWQNEMDTGDHQDLDVYRQRLPRMEGAARKRMMNKLMGQTQYRQNDDGTYSFLLHRGMGKEEKDLAHQGDGHVAHDKNTSWSPRYHVSTSFGDEIPVSAWIHENDIHTMPMMHGKLNRPHDIMSNPEIEKPKGKNYWGNEKEIIVGEHKSPLAFTHEIEPEYYPTNIDQRVNQRSRMKEKDLEYGYKETGRDYQQRKSQIEAFRAKNSVKKS